MCTYTKNNNAQRLYIIYNNIIIITPEYSNIIFNYIIPGWCGTTVQYGVVHGTYIHTY